MVQHVLTAPVSDTILFLLLSQYYSRIDLEYKLIVIIYNVHNTLIYFWVLPFQSKSSFIIIAYGIHFFLYDIILRPSISLTDAPVDSC